MKKIITLCIAFLSFYVDGACNSNLLSFSYGIRNGKQTTREIRIDILTIGGGKPRPRPRSIQAEIEAELDLNANQLFVEFNEVFGRVTIQVNNSVGQVVSSYSCDTGIEPIAFMGISDYADTYTITIIGEEIEAYGYYEISDFK